VKILLDINVPAPLRYALRGHEVVCANEVGWETLENGALLTAAETAGFEVVVTCDQNMPRQQNFAGRRIALVVLSTNKWSALRPVLSRLPARIDFAQRGQITRIDVAAL
jgi:hypothetical protein